MLDICVHSKIVPSGQSQPHQARPAMIVSITVKTPSIIDTINTRLASIELIPSNGLSRKKRSCGRTVVISFRVPTNKYRKRINVRIWTTCRN